MHCAEAVPLSRWRAQLALEFERRGERTVLAAHRHEGPLLVQKALYPEGGRVCHAIVLHPPAGIAGGDELELRARARRRSHALLTTPGAGKWYRTAGPWARQSLRFDAADGAALEWLPQETIVYDGALGDSSTEVRLEGDARFLGWEVLCLGRTGSGERYSRGTFLLKTTLMRDGRKLWFESGCIEGGGALLDSPAGLRGAPVCGTFLAAACGIDAGLVPACREPRPATGECAVTCLPGVVVARYLGSSSEAAKRYFAQLWRLLRPALIQREAVEPRIWRT